METEVAVSKRKHISWKTKCAAAVLCMMERQPVVLADDYSMYSDAKKMTEDQFLSLFQWDHNILHSSEHEDRDKFWNLMPTLIKAHRTKTKADAKIIAKSKRIRGKHVNIRAALDESLRLSRELLAAELLLGVQRQKAEDVSAVAIRPARILQSRDFGPEAAYRSIKSRGFDKTKTKGFDGKVRDRK